MGILYAKSQMVATLQTGNNAAFGTQSNFVIILCRP